MSTTLIICPACGGFKGGAGSSGVGRRCTCTATGTGTVGASGVGMATAGTATVTGQAKVCSVCDTDVTDKKRMKDSTSGRYWCYDCYVIEQRKKQSGMTMTCAHCKKNFPPLRMVKHGEVWWCEICQDAEDAKRGKKKKPTATAAAANGKASHSNSEGNSRTMLVVAVLACVLLVLWFTMGGGAG
jgi:hypothetical protein